MRGKAERRWEDWMSGRITPAYAGKSVRQSRTCGNGQDHPRLCGEKFLQNFHSLPLHGSPPPMRGKVYTTPPMLFIYRITPAYAGKRMVAYYSVMAEWDHPRLCGEKPPSLGTSQPVGGSPPPMRGKVSRRRPV